MIHFFAYINEEGFYGHHRFSQRIARRWPKNVLKNLQELGIATIEDLLTYYPFRYDDIQEKDLSEIQDQEKVTLKRASGFGSSR